MDRYVKREAQQKRYAEATWLIVKWGAIGLIISILCWIVNKDADRERQKIESAEKPVAMRISVSAPREKHCSLFSKCGKRRTYHE